MNKGQKALAGLLAVVAVELLPVTIVATQVVMGEVEVTYEVNEDELEELENELSEAAAVAERDMNEEGE